MAQNLGRNE